ncbi:MAG TPA: hypothetical protein VLZ77_04470, partial [Acidimicrobiales bacterium]|nr:hypothetical protein [Acidimicrobiales bacterium]
AIRMTADSTDTSFIWPARHEAGARSDPSLPPMGARFRLRTSYDISGYSAQARVVLRAMQRYGLILADNGSNWYFGGTSDPAWPQSLVDELKRVPASAFDAVDESSLMVSPDSGQVRTPSTATPAPVRPAPPTTTVVRPTAITTSSVAGPPGSIATWSTTTSSTGPEDARPVGAQTRALAPARSTGGGGPAWWAIFMGAFVCLCAGVALAVRRSRRRRGAPSDEPVG